jgi:hypothetical protein
MRDQHGIVPGIADLLLGGAGGSLHDLGGIAIDGRGKMFREPALRRPRLTQQQQRAVGHQRGNGDFDQSRLANVLGGNL